MNALLHPRYKILNPPWIAATLCILVSACSDEKKPYQAPLPQTPAAYLFQSERQALEKARGVEQTLDMQQKNKAGQQ